MRDDRFEPFPISLEEISRLGDVLLRPVVDLLEQMRLGAESASAPDSLVSAVADLGTRFAVQFEQLRGDSASEMDWIPEVGVLTQLWVAVCDLLDAYSLMVNEDLGLPDSPAWVRFPRLRDARVHEDGVGILLAGAIQPLKFALRRLFDYVNVPISVKSELKEPAERLAQTMFRDLDRVHSLLAATYGRVPKELQDEPERLHTVRKSCLTAAQARKFIGPEEFECRLSEDRLFVVSDWSRAQLFPRFQFDYVRDTEPHRVTEFADWLLDDTDLDPKSWNTVLWLDNAFNKSIGRGDDTRRTEAESQQWIRDMLRSRTRIRSEWLETYPDDLASERAQVSYGEVDAREEWYRITLSPYDAVRFGVAPSPSETSSAGGRWSFPPSCGKGAMYLVSARLDGQTSSEFGAMVACHEVFDREPLPSLNSLFTHSMRRFINNNRIDRVADLRQLRRTDHWPRRKTQRLAGEIVQSRRKPLALVVGQATVGTATGIVLVGPANAPHIPPQLGEWHHDSWQIMRDRWLWSYVEKRYDDWSFPFLLQRLPTDVKLIRSPVVQDQATAGMADFADPAPASETGDQVDSNAQATEPVADPDRRNVQGLALSWPVVAGGLGMLAAVLVFGMAVMPPGSIRNAAIFAALIGTAVATYVATRNPRWFYRRLLSSVIAAWLSLNSLAVYGEAEWTASDGSARFQVSSGTGIFLNVLVFAVVIALLVAAIMNDRRSD